jgi:hypothetical protein
MYIVLGLISYYIYPFTTFYNCVSLYIFWSYVPLIDTTPTTIVIRLLNVIAVLIFQFYIIGFLPSKVFEISHFNKRQLKSEGIVNVVYVMNTSKQLN